MAHSIRLGKLYNIRQEKKFSILLFLITLIHPVTTLQLDKVHLVAVVRPSHNSISLRNYQSLILQMANEQFRYLNLVVVIFMVFGLAKSL